MAKVRAKRRSFQIKQKQKRKKKLKKLRQKYKEAKSKSKKQEIFEKARRISPLIKKEEFLEPIKQ